MIRLLGRLLLPQNLFLHNGLQGITCEQFIVQNEMLGYCRMEQMIDRRGAKNKNAERRHSGRTAP